MANWFTSMNVRERRTFAACFTGWALDAMDVQLYAVVMPTLIGLWAMSQAQAGTLATAALLFSSVAESSWLSPYQLRSKLHVEAARLREDPGRFLQLATA